MSRQFNKPKVLLWLDDARDPNARNTNWRRDISNWYTNHDVVWVKSYDAFVHWIQKHGVPEVISFDHDLGDQSSDEKTGYSAAKWLVEYCMYHRVNIPRFRIHSANPVGEENIRRYLTNACKHLQDWSTKG